MKLQNFRYYVKKDTATTQISYHYNRPLLVLSPNKGVSGVKDNVLEKNTRILVDVRQSNF